MFYGDAQNAGKAAYLAELSGVYQDNAAMPCVIGGDFNIIRKNDEKNKPIGNYHWSFIFSGIVEHVGLRELPLNGRNFTCASMKNWTEY